MENVIAVSVLRKSFGRTRALDGWTLTSGLVLRGFLGQNGSGKTTAIRMLLRLMRADQRHGADARRRAVGRGAHPGRGGYGGRLVYGLGVGDVGRELPRVLAGAMVQLPAVWLLAGGELSGLLPRLASGGGWIPLAAFVLLWVAQMSVQLRQWLLDTSTFNHIPRLQGGMLTVAPLARLTAATAVLVVIGLAGLRRRDIGRFWDVAGSPRLLKGSSWQSSRHRFTGSRPWCAASAVWPSESPARR